MIAYRDVAANTVLVAVLGLEVFGDYSISEVLVAPHDTCLGGLSSLTSFLENC